MATELLVVPATPWLSVPERLPVIDGGWLLNKARKKKMTTFGAVYGQYLDYVSEHSGPSVVISDGYRNSTKDHEHLRRQKSSKKRENEISINPDIQTTSNQDAFFANVENKVSFIGELSLRLENEGHSVLHCPADADTTVVAKAMNLCKDKHPVTIVVNDTDILVMLMYHWEDGLQTCICREKHPERRVRNIWKALNPIIKRHILFAHAWLGCDTTSHYYGYGKNSIVRLLKKNTEVRRLAEVIDKCNDAETVEIAGCKIFSVMYGGKLDGSLTKQGYQKFNSRMAQSNSVDVPRISPSERTAHFHTLHVHLQVRVWKLLDETA